LNCALEDFFYEVLGLWAGNEHGGSDAKGKAVEFGLAEDVLDGLAGEAASDEGAKLIAVDGWVGPMRDHPRAVALAGVSAEEMERKLFSVAPSAFWVW